MLPRGPEPLLVARTFDAHAHDFDRWYKRHAALSMTGPVEGGLAAAWS